MFGELSMAQTGCNMSVDVVPLPFPLGQVSFPTQPGDAPFFALILGFLG